MSDKWDGKTERRRGVCSDAHADAVTAQSDSTSILLELQKLNLNYEAMQKSNNEAQEDLMTLLSKHDNCLYGEDGRGGIVSVVGFLQKAGYVLLTLISAVSFIDVVRFFKGN